MTKIAYLDCPTGIAGDMCLGALVDAGVPLTYLKENLDRLGIAKQYRLWSEKVQRNGQQATKLHVQVITDAGVMEEVPGSVLRATPPRTHSHALESNHQQHPETSHPPESQHSPHNHDHPDHDHHDHDHNHATGTRHLLEIEQMIRVAKLPTQVETWSLAVFHQLAAAEAAVHGMAAEQVHFHEVGAIDAIVDIVGTCLGLHWLGIDHIFCSALPSGGGTIWTAHGHLPVPAPAVLKLFELRQTPIYSNGIQKELVTPTGAAIVTALATQFGTHPSMTLLRVGLGAGTIDLPLPNILRLWIGEQPGGKGKERQTAIVVEPERQENSQSRDIATLTETVTVLETQVDDITPQAIGYLYQVLFAAGALDVFTQSVGMKKSRTGLLLTVICPPPIAATCEAILFRETTTLGIRRSPQQRHILHRELQTVETPYGPISVKVAWADADRHTPVNVQPEYEDCAAIAQAQDLPWREVHRVALEGWYGERQKAKGKRVL